MNERRQRPEPTTGDELLRELPAQVILDRMPTPVIGLSSDGVLGFANPAFAEMLGYRDVAAVLSRSLGALLGAHAPQPPEDCLAILRKAGSTVIDWSHAEGFLVRTTVSKPLLLRATDPLLLFTISDVTEMLWGEASPKRRR